MTELDFEPLYEEAMCQCGEEVLDLEWDSDERSFIANCSCLKKHCITPTKCVVTIECDDPQEEDY